MPDEDDNVIAFNLRDAFLLRQDQLLSTLGISRGVPWHAGTIGDDSELNWIGMLRQLLPTRYRVDQAFVVSADGDKSEQLDVVIYDRHFSPLLFEVGKAQFIPAESVYAVFEVKQTLNREHLEYASGKVESVRRLRRTSAPVPHAGGTFEPRVPPRILGGFLSLGSGWSPPFGAPFRECLGSLTDNALVDMGCVLQAGSFEIPAERPASDVQTAEGDSALLFFVFRLLQRLQTMASAPAIDFEDYGKTLFGSATVEASSDTNT